MQRLGSVLTNNNTSNHITQKNKAVNEILRQQLTNEMFIEVQETFQMIMDPTTNTLPLTKLPLALKALGMSLQDMTTYDTNKIPSELDLDKFIEVILFCLKQPNWAANEMNEVFESFDKDSSGYVDPNELRNIFQKIGENLLEVELNDQLREVDIDGDLQMAIAEFYNMVSIAKGTDFQFEDQLF